MIILGLGSNLGDRLLNLRRAVTFIKAHRDISVKQVSPVYVSDALIPENAPLSWHMPYLNAALRCECKLTALELLHELKQIEEALGRDIKSPRWSPRVIDIDILAIDDLQIKNAELAVPHPSLTERPFALWPLNDVAPLWQLPHIHSIMEKWGSRFAGEAPFHTRQIMQRIDMPQLVGILNITSNSFSDGGQFVHTEDALRQARHLIASGAEILDIGAEATSPHAKPKTADEEWLKLHPLLAAIREANAQGQFLIPPKISIDTFHPETAQKAIDLADVHWINDVTGLFNPKMRDVIANAKSVDCVMMHHVSIPASREHILSRDCDPLKFLFEWGQKQLALLATFGIEPERIIFDPGIGFGKVPEQSLMLVKEANRFRDLGVRVLYGHSRKLFLSLFTDKTFAERDLETTLMGLYLAKQGGDYLRVHDVEMIARAFKINAAL